MYEENNEDNKRKNWGKILLAILAIVIVFLIVFLLLKYCGKKSDLESVLLKAGKEYYTDVLPANSGECKKVTLDELINKKLVNESKFKDCDNKETYVQACKLESGSYQYTPVLDCTDNKTDFGNWTKGTETNLVTDKSDVMFNYLGEYSAYTLRNYYPKNLTDEKDVKEYYTEEPTGYNKKGESSTEATKWYTNKETKSYWNKGEYSSTAPSGYTLKDSEKSEVKASATRPQEESYRTITTAKVYRSRVIESTARAYKWVCIDRVYEGEVISNTPCNLRTQSTHKEIKTIYYTCDGKTNVDYNTACKPTDWSTWGLEACKNTTTSECQTTNGYKYTDLSWKWYKKGTVKSYYPSGSSTASSEKTYYIEAPSKGYISDETTKTTAYKFYKTVEVESTVENALKDWIAITNEFVSYDKMIEKFKELKHEVNSLEDINKDESIRYNLELWYRDRR